jgi:hypothetical protein
MEGESLRLVGVQSFRSANLSVVSVLKRTAPSEKPMNVPMMGNGCGRLLGSKRAPEGDDGDAYGSFWSGYGLSLKLSGADSLTSCSTMPADSALNRFLEIYGAVVRGIGGAKASSKLRVRLVM